MERIEFDLLFRWFVGLGSMIRYETIRAFPRTASGFWQATSPPIPRCGTVPGAGQAVVIERAFLGRRYVDRGLGLGEESQAEDGPLTACRE